MTTGKSKLIIEGLIDKGDGFELGIYDAGLQNGECWRLEGEQVSK